MFNFFYVGFCVCVFLICFSIIPGGIPVIPPTSGSSMAPENPPPAPAPAPAPVPAPNPTAASNPNQQQQQLMQQMLQMFAGGGTAVCVNVYWLVKLLASVSTCSLGILTLKNSTQCIADEKCIISFTCCYYCSFPLPIG